MSIGQSDEAEMTLWDDPNSDEYYILDHRTQPPVHYDLLGHVAYLPIGLIDEDAIRPADEVRSYAESRGWTAEALYATVPEKYRNR